MSIHIKNINVKDLGPIPELEWNLSNLNLVYGDNERGKSYLVEFLIRCLFKTSGWNLRKKTGTGRIEVEGLLDEIVGFTPGSSQKLEDFLTDKYIGLPPDFSKLLVLRGTNVELGEEEESDKIMLRKYLSHKEILDKIMENAQETVKNCSISSGYRITGDNRGRLKNRKELESKLKRIEELFTDVGNKFLGGEMKVLEDKKKRLSEKYNNFEKAKRWKAYQLSEKMKELKEEADKIDKEKIDEFASGIKYSTRVKAVFRNYFDKKYSQNHNIFFSGQAIYPIREKLLQIVLDLQDRRKDLRIIFQRIHKFFSGWDLSQYFNKLSNSKICLRPNVSVETYRHFEDSRHGCVTISTPLPGVWYFKSALIQIVGQWNELPELLGELFNNLNQFEEMSRKSIGYRNSRFSPKAMANFIDNSIYSLT